MSRRRPGIGSRRHTVFVSHATADKWLAKVLCEKVESVGARTFRDDRDINGGEDIPDAIRMAIKQSAELVVLLTPESAHRTWVMLEVGAAWGHSKRKRITVVMCHVNVDPIPDIIKAKKAISLNDFDAYIRELASRLKKARR